MNRKRFLSGIWPVVRRELREGARRRVNHRLRSWSGVFGALLLWVVASDNAGKRPAEIGAWLLVSMHILLLGLIFLVVPLMTADCIAREKRDGTLGLLFLTPLSAGGIVAGKVISVALRALTLWLAVLPMLVVPFLEGGINWLDASSATIIEFCAAVLCLAAGLLASSLTENRNTAVILSLVFAVVFLMSFAMLFTSCFMVMSGFPARAGVPVFDVQWLIMISGVIMSGMDGAGWYRMVLFVGTTRLWYAFCAVSPLLVSSIAWLIGRFATRRVERSWQDKAPTVKRQRLVQRYCTPLFQQRFRRKMQRSLDWNPIAWLQQYSWKARVTKWGLCLALIVIEQAIAFTGNVETFVTGQVVLLAVLGMVYIFVGVNSFIEEKRSGALELLLVTPVSVNTIIFGRTWGLWKQFGPSLLIVAAVVGLRFKFLWDLDPLFSFPGSVYRGMRSNSDQLLVFCNFLTLPIFATYAALRVKNLLAAAGLTVVGALLPVAFAKNAASWAQWRQDDVAYMATVAIGYAAFAALACFLLRHSLSRRIYSF